MKKKFLGLTCFAVALCATVGGTVALNTTANAENAYGWVNDYQTTSRSGKTYTGTAISFEMLGSTNGGGQATQYSSLVKLPGTYSVDDLAKGFTFQIDPNEKQFYGSAVQIRFVDSKNSSQYITTFVAMDFTFEYTTSFAWCDWDSSLYRTGWDGWMTVGRPTGDVKLPQISGVQQYTEDGTSNGVTSGATGVFGTNVDQPTNVADYTTAINIAIDEDGINYNTVEMTKDYNASKFTSGEVKIEMSFYVQPDHIPWWDEGNGAINVISVGNTSLAKLDMNTPEPEPEIEWINDYQTTSRSGKTYTGTAISFEKGGEHVIEGRKAIWSKAVTLPDAYSTADIAKGFTFQIDPNEKQFYGSALQIRFVDSVNESSYISTFLSIDTNITTWEYTTAFAWADWDDDLSRYGLDGWYAWSGPHSGWLPEVSGIQQYAEDGTSNGVTSSATGVFGTNVDQPTNVADYTTAVNIAIDEDGINYNTVEMTKDYNASKFTSGKVKIEMFLFIQTDTIPWWDEGNGVINLISVGEKSLAKLGVEEPKSEEELAINEMLGGMEMTAGASIRLSEAGNGIRFETNVDKVVADEFMASDLFEEVAFGTVIVPVDYLTEGETLETLRVAGKVAMLEARGFYEAVSTEDTYKFWGSLVDIRDYNYYRAFIGVGYIKTVVDGVETYNYLAYDLNNARSLYSVAVAAYNYEGTSAEDKQLIKEQYIDTVVVLNENGEYAGGIEGYEAPYSIDMETGVITSTSVIKTVVAINGDGSALICPTKYLEFSADHKSVKIGG